MSEWFTNISQNGLVESARQWADTYLFVSANYIQLGIILVAFVTARFIANRISLKLHLESREPMSSKVFQGLLGIVLQVATPLLLLVFLWIAVGTSIELGWPKRILVTASSLCLAWVVIRIASTSVRNEFWRKIIATFAWGVAALNIVGLLDPTIILLENAAFNVGTYRLSLLGLVKAIMSLVVLVWVAAIFSRLADRQIAASATFTPSVEVLLSKFIKITAITIAVVIALSGLGLDLSAFAVFSGAVGVGLGFGLQKIVSNFVSGIILLLDKSIKPGDVISVPDYYGRVNEMGARYVSVITRDGIEHLIPNEELIVQRVENWSHSHDKIRLRQAVGVHYQCDLPKAIELCLEAARESERVLDDPNPVCLLRGFGDSSVDLEIRFWISDPVNGRANVKSAILLKVWEKFHQHGIEIPYPQRDLHLRTPDAHIPVKIMRE